MCLAPGEMTFLLMLWFFMVRQSWLRLADFATKLRLVQFRVYISSNISSFLSNTLALMRAIAMSKSSSKGRSPLLGTYFNMLSHDVRGVEAIPTPIACKYHCKGPRVSNLISCNYGFCIMFCSSFFLSFSFSVFSFLFVYIFTKFPKVQVF